MTLKEISKELGVSPSIISRVLNGYTRNFSISENVRQRILDYVEKTGYKANPVFQSLKKRHSNQIAILIYSHSISGTGYTLETMTDRAAKFFDEREYEISFTFNRVGNTGGAFSLPPWKCAGYLIPDCINLEQLTNIASSGAPYVVMNGIAGPNGTAVQADEDDSMAQIMRHLHALGHRRIAFVKIEDDIPQATYDIAYMRLQAFKTYAKQYGIEPLLVFLKHGIGAYDFIGATVRHSDNSADVIYEGNDFTQALMYSGMTAVVCESYFGMPFLHSCLAAGVRVPQDISLVCYNDLPFMKFVYPAITTFRVPAEEMGAMAAQILYDKLTKDKDYRNGETLKLKGNLIFRETTAPAAK